MKVTAIKPGFFGKYRETGEQFDVPDGSKATWFKSSEQIEAEAKAFAAKTLTAQAEKAQSDAVNANRAAEQAKADLAAANAKLEPAKPIVPAPKEDAGNSLV